jgi:ATP-dependent helicase HrpB
LNALAEAQRVLLAALRGVLARHRDAVLSAPTGIGKSTLVPLGLLREPWLAGRKIRMLEPRRLAARALAGRMAALLGETVGQTVGYRMRLDTRVSRSTRIEVLTEGVLTRLLQEDPALEDTGLLIFDEFHERSLAADLGLALALDAREQLDAGFRILIMSATLECERVSALLQDAGVASVPGRTFEVALRYLGNGAPSLPDSAHPIEKLLVPAVLRALGETEGGVLVFLPGAGEIRRVERALRDTALPPEVSLLTLYGEMTGESQDAVLSPAAPGQRKLVLATNIAETSLTIPEITAVVDAGLVRRSRFDPATGMSRLELGRISRAASEQRAGRAGRVAPGVCYRLWSEAAQARLAPSTPAEMLEADLAPLALELARWGAHDAARLRWLDAPPEASLAQARELLQRLGALDDRGALSPSGSDLARLSAHPRLGHMLLAARGFGALELAAQIAALLSERDLLTRAPGGDGRDPDLRTRLELLRRASDPSASDQAALQRVRRNARSLQQATAALPGGARFAAAGLTTNADERCGALLALAYPDRIGQRRPEGTGRYLLSNGRGAHFAGPTSLAREAFIVAAGLDDREREARIDLAAPLASADLETVFAPQILTEETFGWDAREAAVAARSQRRLGALVLESRPVALADDPRVAAAVADGIRQLGLEALPWDTESRTLQARMQFVRALSLPAQADWPASDDATLLEQLPVWLTPYLQGVTRREHWSRLPLSQALSERLSATQRRTLEVLAPRTLGVPSGSHIRIDYLDDSAPAVAVKLQEVFGLTQTPRIGGGAVAVTFKLLSPAQRPVQITRDLAGFWRSSYAEVRKDMRGRYPRHHWPENPLEAAPSRRTLRPRDKPPKS